MTLSPSLGLLSRVRSVAVTGAAKTGMALLPVSPNGQDLHLMIPISLTGKEEANVDILYDAGIELEAPIEAPRPGGTSFNLRILGMRAEGGRVSAELEGLSGRDYTVRVHTSLPIRGIKGGERVAADPKQIHVSFPSADPPRWIRSTLEIEVQRAQ